MNKPSFKTLHKYNVEHSADSIEWCPHDPFKNLFACANYYLEKDSNERKGRLLLFSIAEKNNLKLLQTLSTEAILDQKWCRCKVKNESYLAVATSKNTVLIYRINPALEQLQLVTSYKIPGEDEGNLILSLDWNTGKYFYEDPEIACSNSSGKIHLLKFTNDELKAVFSQKGHDYEAWIAAFYYWDSNIFFSGGDDSVFLKFDRRCGSDAVAKNKTHEAGVTCLHSNSEKEFILASGSYDSNLRLWDVRCMKTPVQTLQLPGTLWRIKWNPFDSQMLMVASMLGGLHVIKSTDELSLMATYDEHENIVYGGDWCFLDKSELEDYRIFCDYVLGSCSFYDHLLCLSAFSE